MTILIDELEKYKRWRRAKRLQDAYTINQLNILLLLLIKY